MPLDITATLWEEIRDRNREAQVVVKFEWINGTLAYGGRAGQHIDTDMNDALVDRRDLEPEP